MNVKVGDDFFCVCGLEHKIKGEAEAIKCEGPL